MSLNGSSFLLCSEVHLVFLQGYFVFLIVFMCKLLFFLAKLIWFYVGHFGVFNDYWLLLCRELGLSRSYGYLCGLDFDQDLIINFQVYNLQVNQGLLYSWYLNQWQLYDGMVNNGYAGNKVIIGLSYTYRNNLLTHDLLIYWFIGVVISISFQIAYNIVLVTKVKIQLFFYN